MRSVGRGGTLSRVVTVAVRVLEPVPALAVGPAVAVGAGAGVPAVGNGSVWVPATADGSLAHVADGAVVERTAYGTAPPGGGFLDSAVVAEGAVWAASDAGARIARIDPASGAITARLDVAERSSRCSLSQRKATLVAATLSSPTLAAAVPAGLLIPTLRNGLPDGTPTHLDFAWSDDPTTMWRPQDLERHPGLPGFQLVEPKRHRRIPGNPGEGCDKGARASRVRS